MKPSRSLQITAILLIIQGFNLLYVTWHLDALLFPLCCPYCPAPGVWDFYIEHILPIIRTLSDIERALLPYIILSFLVSALLALIAGIIGLVYWNTPKRANRCLFWGVAAAAIYPMLLWWGAAPLCALTLGLPPSSSMHCISSVRTGKKRLGLKMKLRNKFKNPNAHSKRQILVDSVPRP